MAMNLRENKMDQFDESKNTRFFGSAKKPKTMQTAPQPKKIVEPKPQKKLQQSKQTTLQKQMRQIAQKKKLQTAPQPKKIYTRSHQKRIERAKIEKWIRKKPKPPLSEEKLDYQETIEYEKEFSQYLREHEEDVLVHWRGPNYEQYPRSKKWYVWASVIDALIILYALWTDSIIMAIVFALIYLVGYLQLSRAPKVIDFAVTYEGILVGEEIYSFDDIKSFWIFYEPPHTRVISLYMKGYLRPYLHIPLHQVDPVIVHRKLVEFVPEEKQEQNIVDILERLLHI